MADFLNLKEAFETVLRELLISKLKGIDIDGTGLNCFLRHQMTRFGNYTSSKVETVTGTVSVVLMKLSVYSATIYLFPATLNNTRFPSLSHKRNRMYLNISYVCSSI